MTTIKLEELRALIERAAMKEAPIASIHVVEAFDQLVADASRYRGVRLIACETDEAKQRRMIDRFDSLEPELASIFEPGEKRIEPEQLDRLVDTMLLELGKVRDANDQV
jgi:hypothetical protein